MDAHKDTKAFFSMFTPKCSICGLADASTCWECRKLICDKCKGGNIWIEGGKTWSNPAYRYGKYYPLCKKCWSKSPSM
jgi:hypothetical protein